MNLKLLISTALITTALTPNMAMAEPIWVNLGNSEISQVLLIDQQSIVKYKSTVSFDMRTEGVNKSIKARVAADCPSLAFQYQALSTNNITNTPPNGIEFPIQTAPSDSVIGTAIYYACATYQRSTF